MNTSTWLLAVAAVFCCCSVGTAAKLTDREAFQKRVAKVAPLADAKPKALCRCVSETDPIFQNRVGFVRHFVSSGQIFVICQGGLFDPDGNDIGAFSCPDFRTLVK